MGKFLKILVTIFVIAVIAFGAYEHFFKGKKSASTSESAGCVPYSDSVSKESKANISEIVLTLANTSTVGLAFKAQHLRDLGANVDLHVPSPLSFLAAIFKDKGLANAMKVVQQSSYKYNNFCEGLYDNMMKNYKDPECFEKNLRAFAKSLNINAEKTFTVAETCGRDGESGDKDAFRPFVDYLIELKAD